MVADRVLRVGAPYDFNSELPIDLNSVRVDAHITFDTENDVNFKPRVQSAIQQVEAESGLKIFPGRFIAQWTLGKIASHGNAFRPLTLPGINPKITPQGSNNSKTNLNISISNGIPDQLLTGYDSNGNLEIYPDTKWESQNIILDFECGVPTNESPQMTFANPDLRQIIASLCRYSFHQDKEDYELVQFLFQRISYASRDAI